MCGQAWHSTQRPSQRTEAFGGLADARKDGGATRGAHAAEAPGLAERGRLLLERCTEDSSGGLLHCEVGWVAPLVRMSPPWPIV